MSTFRSRASRTAQCFASGASLWLLACTAMAQAGAPNSGSILRQLEPSTLAKPETDRSVLPQAPPSKAVTAPLSGGPTLAVSAFRIVGVDDATATRLQPLLGKYTGPGKTLLDLEDAAKDVEVALQREGFFLAQAYVPEQRLTEGVVTVQVLIGRLGSVKLEAEPGVKVDAAFMDRIVDRLRGHPVVERGLIEHALFTLGDLRGIAVHSSLTPGERIGHADLVIKVSPAKTAAYAVEYDNAGSIYTGRHRVYGSADWFSLAGRGDVASLRAQAASGTQFLRASWLTPYNAVGSKVGVALSLLRYELGTAVFDPLDAEGTAAALSLQWLHPVIRSRNRNLFFQISTDLRQFDDEVNAIALDSKKSMTAYATFAAVGDFRDTFAGGGISNYAAGIVMGNLKIKTPDEAYVDDNSYRSAGSYAKLVLNGSRLQVLPNKDYLFLSAQAQLASKNLDSSEKLSMGGPDRVRGYPSPESPSDSGVIATWEYRKPLRFESVPGDLVFAVFGDYGYARQHESPLATDTGNTRKLMSHGVGLTYANRSGLLVKGWVAMRGDTKAQSDDSKARAVIQVSQQF